MDNGSTNAPPDGFDLDDIREVSPATIMVNINSERRQNGAQRGSVLTTMVGRSLMA